MSELRRDPLSDRWVIIAEERMLRPQDAQASADFELPPLDPEADPFAEGNEHLTPGEIYAVRDSGAANEPGWRIRVVPNRYPMLRVEGELKPRAEGVYDTMQGVGAHEVVIETPCPDAQMRNLSLEHLGEILETFRLRIDDLSRDRRLAHIVVFKNHGRSAGATQVHSHSQLVGLPIVPLRTRRELELLEAHYQRHGRNLWQDILDQELASGERIVFETDAMVVFCPWASCFPFELLILPRLSGSDFRASTAPEIRDLAVALQTALLKLYKALGEVAWNMVLHTCPFDTYQGSVHADYPNLDATFRWRIELVPRLTRIAGFELGTGQYVNPVPPETAARFLRGLEEGAR